MFFQGESSANQSQKFLFQFQVIEREKVCISLETMLHKLRKKNRFKPCVRREGNKGSEAIYLQIPLKILREVASANKVAIYSGSYKLNAGSYVFHFISIT